MKLLFILALVNAHSEEEGKVIDSTKKWWSSFQYDCGQGGGGEHYKLPDRECMQSHLTSPLRHIEPRILNGLKETIDKEMDFECIKRTVHFIRAKIVNSASMGHTSVVFNNYNFAIPDSEESLVIHTPLISCQGINDCDLFIHGIEQEIVYMFKGSKINISKSDSELKTLEISWD
jgi:hypothetical protein